MKRKTLIVVAAAVALWSAAAFALPSFQEVEAAVKAGDYPKAESMVQEVVAAKPQSAKAHYVYAELLAHDGKFADAAGQARRAREIDPSLAFASSPEKFRSFEQELQTAQGQGTARPAPSQMSPGMAPAPVREHASSGLPGWVWGLGLALLAVFIFRAVSRRAATASAVPGSYGMAPGSPQPGYGPGYGGGYGPGYGQPSAGSGMLRTGLAAAGGVAAGMLAEKWLEGRHEGYADNGGGGGGYIDNGAADAARDLENRQIDFGGGNDWDSGGGGGDNFTPSGGGGSDDGGW